MTGVSVEIDSIMLNIPFVRCIGRYEQNPEKAKHWR